MILETCHGNQENYYKHTPVIELCAAGEQLCVAAYVGLVDNIPRNQQTQREKLLFTQEIKCRQL